MIMGQVYMASGVKDEKNGDADDKVLCCVSLKERQPRTELRICLGVEATEYVMRRSRLTSTRTCRMIGVMPMV